MIVDLTELERDPLLVVLGDCVDVMRTMPEASVDAICTDPPYGLEFMGKEWDRFRVDDPGTTRNRGDRAGAQGEAGAGDGSHPARGRSAVEYGGGKRARTARCTGCGKRDQYRNAHECKPSARWVSEVIDPYAAPPTSLAFEEWTRMWAIEAYRVAKPGAYLLAFGGTRMHHRLMTAIEEAGWQIRDTIMWLYGQGFPKSLDIGGAFDKKAGVDREVVGVKKYAGQGPDAYGSAPTSARGFGVGDQGEAGDFIAKRGVTEPVTELAKQWDGWGTALKPAWEPIVMAQKPLEGTNTENLQRYGIGALNIDGARVGLEGEQLRAPQSDPTKRRGTVGTDLGITAAPLERFQEAQRESTARANDLGRWPANVVLMHAPECRQIGEQQVLRNIIATDPKPTATNAYMGRQDGSLAGGSRSLGAIPETVPVFECVADCPVRMLDEQAPDAGAAAPVRGSEPSAPTANAYGDYRRQAGTFFGDRGGASRFFYTAKASRADRGPGNTHPTVKPVDLMRYLVRLVAPAGAVVLDPFAGSGSTGQAALSAGMKCVLIERLPEYVDGIRTWRAAMQLGNGLG